MPIYRFGCSCGFELVDLFKLDETPAYHCDKPMTLRPPQGVVGKVVGSLASVARESNRQDDLASAKMAHQKSTEPAKLDPAHPDYLPPTTYTKGIKDCNAAEKDARWRESKEAFTHWQTKRLESSGWEYGKAKKTAEAHQTKIITEARQKAKAE